MNENRSGLVARMWSNLRERRKLSGKEALSEEWKRQADKLIALGFHREVYESDAEAESKYRESLPEFPPQPKRIRGLPQFNIPLLVETRIPIDRQMELAEVQRGRGLQVHGPIKISDQIEIRDDIPYAISAGNPGQYEEHTMLLAEAYMEHNGDETPCTLREVLAAYLQRPDLFTDFAVTALGSRTDQYDIPYIFTKDDITFVSAFPDKGNKVSKYSSLSRSK